MSFFHPCPFYISICTRKFIMDREKEPIKLCAKHAREKFFNIYVQFLTKTHISQKIFRFGRARQPLLKYARAHLNNHVICAPDPARMQSMRDVTSLLFDTHSTAKEIVRKNMGALYEHILPRVNCAYSQCIIQSFMPHPCVYDACIICIA